MGGLELTFQHQNSWHLGIAIYLFLGGLGGAMGFLAALNHLVFKNKDNNMHFWGTFLGVVLVNIGGLFLLVHMLQPFKFFLALFGAAAFEGNFHPWIMWGANVIVIFTLSGILWSLLLKMNKESKLTNFLGWVTLVSGVGTFTYTGFLLSVAPAIPAWSHPLVPVLFATSALSTATAFYMLYTYFSSGDEKRLWWGKWNEKVDIVLIIAELIMLGAYFNYLYYANAGGKYVFEHLTSDTGFVFGFLILGLIVPLILEILALTKKIKTFIPIAAILVLVGGFLLRYYILHYGVYVYPWPS